MGNHYREVLAPGSPFVGQNCPVSRRTLQAGHEVVICADSQTAFQAESWEYLEEVCPFCSTGGAEVSVTQVVEERPPAAAAWLSIPGHPTFPLVRDIVNLGRGLDNDLILDDGHISEHHARVRRTGKVFYLFDLASTNGTWVNDHRIYRLLLRDGDRIRMGNTVLIFKRATEDEFSGMPA